MDWLYGGSKMQSLSDNEEHIAIACGKTNWQLHDVMGSVQSSYDLLLCEIIIIWRR